MKIELWIDTKCRLEKEEQEYIESLREILPVVMMSDIPGSIDFAVDENVKREQNIKNQEYAVYLGDDSQRIRQMKKRGYPVIAYLREDMPIDVSPYAVESLLALDEEYLTRVYCHSKGIPQVITSTDRLIIREMAMTDLDALLEIYETNEITPFFQTFYDNREEAAAYLADYIKNVYDFYGFGIWGICLKENSNAAGEGQEGQTVELSVQCPMIGIIGLTPREGALELGYALAKAYQGKKYIVEARKAMIEYGRKKLGNDKIIEITNR